MSKMQSRWSAQPRLTMRWNPEPSSTRAENPTLPIGPSRYHPNERQKIADQKPQSSKMESIGEEEQNRSTTNDQEGKMENIPKSRDDEARDKNPEPSTHASPPAPINPMHRNRRIPYTMRINEYQPTHVPATVQDCNMDKVNVNARIFSGFIKR